MNGQFEEASTSADVQVENILLSAKTATESITAYIEKAYKMSAQGAVNMTGASRQEIDSQQPADNIHISSIYDVEITQLSADVEKYVTEVVPRQRKATLILLEWVFCLNRMHLMTI